ncbi:hypothetical protein [Campylobacter concisus]|uniref:hypothetical protein n=2 Tax=Campylobacter concisus TaxID=199 RepID=UPI003D1E412C
MENIEKYRQIESTLKLLLDNKHEVSLKQILDEIDIYLQWLSSIKSKYGITKEYPLEHISEQIFSDITRDNYKMHVLAMSITIEEVRSDLKRICQEDKDGSNIKANSNNCVKGLLALLNDIILDINEVLWQIEEIIFQNPQTTKSGRRRLFFGREIFGTSKNIVRRLVDYSGISYSSASVFLIRQAIEVTILRALGIIAFVDKDGKEQKFKMDKIFNFIKNNRKNIKFPIEFSILDKIIKWSDVYVHKGIMYYHWQIIVAQKVLLPLFRAGNDGKNYSLSGAIQINRQFYEKELDKELIKFLELRDDVTARRLKSPDSLLTDKVFEYN